MAEGAWRGPPANHPQGTMRIRSEMQTNPVPPACVQNAMMTKDKKPFTYTPGGIDLSEIRSPRMAKRIERNAQAPGVGEVPKSPNTYYPSGPLPPSAQAAMHTNMPVQVFPSGAPPLPPPLPPPMQQQASGRGAPPPPPPPPPQEPLPTKSVSTNEGVFDRPDMTRIIPENPMAMLRKTPKADRKSFLDELNDLEIQQKRPTNQQNPPIRQNNVANLQQQQNHAPQTPPVAPQTPRFVPQPQQFSPQATPQTARFEPKVQPFSPQSPRFEPQTQPFVSQIVSGPSQFVPQPPQAVSQYVPQSQEFPHQVTPQTARFEPKVQPFSPQSPRFEPQTQPCMPQMVSGQLEFVPQTSQYSPTVQQYPVHSPQPYNNPGSNQQRSQIGSLYIPPVAPSNGNNNDVASPPTPPLRHPQSPQSPQVQLNKAPRPWQNQKRDDDKPTWAHKASSPQECYIAPPYNPPEPPRRQQSHNPTDYHQQPQMLVYPDQSNSNIVLNEPPAARTGVEVVWVTQPQVIVHPGVPKTGKPLDGQGGRIIPVQIEREQPPTPERNLHRQQSWGTPTQSNSFKVLQRITSTDGDLDDDSPATEYPPKTAQEFNQTPADQIRKMKMCQDDRELVNKFKQDSMIQYYYLSHYEDEDPKYTEAQVLPVFWSLHSSDQENHQHHHNEEVDPRYRGSAIPSKAFRLLQSMTDSFPANVPKCQQQSVPYVRNIPIQIEGDDSVEPYVHPSQQSVPEPKKYTGGNTPGRSFKMLQSMTGQTNLLGPDQSDL